MPYLEAPVAEEAIAAADTLARLTGKFYDKNAYTEPVDNWVAQYGRRITPSAKLIASAIQAIDRIMTEPSELLDLWKEADGDGWQQQMAALKERLG